jgi:hypothetical protein
MASAVALFAWQRDDAVERHGLETVAAFDPVILPFEGDARLVERDEPGVGIRP